jgi:hypothetical protein
MMNPRTHDAWLTKTWKVVIKESLKAFHKISGIHVWKSCGHDEAEEVSDMYFAKGRSKGDMSVTFTSLRRFSQCNGVTIMTDDICFDLRDNIPMQYAP